MNIQSIDTKPIINIIDGDNNLILEFLSTDKNFLVNQSENNVRLLLKKQTTANIFCDELGVEISFEKKISYLQFVSLKFKFDSIVELHNNFIVFSRGDKDYVIDFQMTKYSFETNDTLLLVLDKYDNKIKITEINNFTSVFRQQNFKAFTVSNSFLIDDTCMMPEFSIGTYDDASFTKPRPVRQGNPVISTVPAMIDSNSSTDDTDYYNSGFGPISKTIYFKIFCNVALESGLSSGDLSSNLQLKIYLPNGLDTVKAPIYVNMYYITASTYSASYTFYKQGRYNSIDYVDGFMYFDVHCPLTVQKSIPFQFDFQLL
jgi:hypothetical protein